LFKEYLEKYRNILPKEIFDYVSDLEEKIEKMNNKILKEGGDGILRNPEWVDISDISGRIYSVISNLKNSK